MNKAELLPEVRRTLAQGFFDFLKTFGIIGLAIDFVIGQAASRLVTAIVNDVIDPIIGLFLPAGSLESMSVKVTNLAGSTRVQIWRFNINIIDFIIVALLVFLAYKQLSKYKLVEDKPKPPSEEKK